VTILSRRYHDSIYLLGITQGEPRSRAGICTMGLRRKELKKKKGKDPRL
jgi:hypothetical protein